MIVEHVINPATGRTWCGMANQPVQGTRKCRNCTHLQALAEIDKGVKKIGRRKGDALGLCPRCGKLIAYVFPLHDCTPNRKRAK